MIREVLGHGRDTLRVPDGVRRWENVYDPNDIFSAPLENLAAKMVLDRVTGSPFAEDVHHIGRYLRDRSTGAALAGALCSSPKDGGAWACASR
jgi:hypothetical protein